MSEPNKIEHVSKHVIENRLLTSLEEDKSRVAILATKEDLDLLIQALRPMVFHTAVRDMLDGLIQLRKEAFP